MEETISLKEIFEVIKKRLLLIILSIVGAALIAGVVSYFILTPTYESSSLFIVNQAEKEKEVRYEVNDIRTNIELINTYNVIIKSNAILDDVSESLNGIYNADQLRNKIQVSSEQDSQVVTVTATDVKPEIAADIANTTVEIFQKEIPEIMNVDNVSVLTKAVTGDNPSPVAPKPMLNIAIAVVLGGMIGVGIAFLLAYLDNTIAREEDIENHLELPVLGVVSHMNAQDVSDKKQGKKASRSKRSEINAQKKSV